MLLRTMKIEDTSDAMRLVSDEGWNQTLTDWQRFLAASPEGCFAMEQDGRVVGTVATIEYENRFAWIGMMLVDAAFRGRGIGRALFEQAVRHLDSLGVPCIKLDATPQGRPLYQKLGFIPEYEIERWMHERPRPQVRPDLLIPEIEDIMEMDREVFGADRSWLLSSLAQAAPMITIVPRIKDRPCGYSFGRHGLRADHMGPWVALDPASVMILPIEFMSRSARELLYVDCVCPNPGARLTLEALGFKLQRPLTRMYRGANHHPGNPNLQCAILGPEFG